MFSACAIEKQQPSTMQNTRPFLTVPPMILWAYNLPVGVYWCARKATYEENDTIVFRCRSIVRRVPSCAEFDGYREFIPGSACHPSESGERACHFVEVASLHVENAAWFVYGRRYWC